MVNEIMIYRRRSCKLVAARVTFALGIRQIFTTAPRCRRLFLLHEIAISFTLLDVGICLVQSPQTD